MRTNKLYLIDLTGLGFTDLNGRTSFLIGEERPYVEAFDIWREPYYKLEKGPGQAGKKPSSDKLAGKKLPADQPTKKENRPPWRH